MTAAAFPSFDNARLYPSVGLVAAALPAGDWAAIQDAFRQASSNYERHRMVDAAARLNGSEHRLAEITGRDPGDVLASTMLAARCVWVGWEARGTGTASTVRADGWRVFRAQLMRAEQLLIEVCAREPGLAQAWLTRLNTARGLQLGIAESRRRYDRLIRHSPLDLIGQRTLLQDLVPKWGGDWERAHAFAWACLNESPAGAPNAAVLADFYLERWVDADGSTATVFGDPRTRQELWQAGDRSVLNPAFAEPPGREAALSVFALVFSLMEDWPRAKHCFVRLGPYADEWGWDYYQDPVKMFTRTRDQAMVRG